LQLIERKKRVDDSERRKREKKERKRRQDKKCNAFSAKKSPNFGLCACAKVKHHSLDYRK